MVHSSTTLSAEAPMPLLDLHGMVKADAIRAVTNFLEIHHPDNCAKKMESHHNERQQSQKHPQTRRKRPQQTSTTTNEVCIVTGTGSHSQRGPVLRNAVEELLKKRRMEFARQGPGSFIVRADSGIVFSHQASTEEDTKLIFRNRQEPEIQQQLLLFNKNKIRDKRFQRMGSQSSPASLPQQPLHVSGPAPREVALNDAEWEQACQESLDLRRAQLKEEKMEKSQLDVAIRLSSLEDQQRANDDESDLQLALRESEMLALKSKQEQDEAAEEIMNRAIAESLQEHQQGTLCNSSSDQLLSEDELQQQLETALQLSLEQLDKHERNEEEELQRVLSLSLKG